MCGIRSCVKMAAIFAMPVVWQGEADVDIVAEHSN